MELSWRGFTLLLRGFLLKICDGGGAEGDVEAPVTSLLLSLVVVFFFCDCLIVLLGSKLYESCGFLTVWVFSCSIGWVSVREVSCGDSIAAF